MKQIKLGLVAEETGFIDCQVFQQARQLFLALVADEQAIVAVERIDLPLFEPSLQAVFEEVRAALIEVHAALLVHQRLQELELGLRKLHGGARRGHEILSFLLGTPGQLPPSVP